MDSWAFYYQNAVGNKDNLKIEINYSMRHHILLFIEKQTEVFFLPSYNIRALSSLELFGSKIKALLERTAARDLYDVTTLIVCTEQEKSFINAFNQNNYQPELLFDDEIIIENIKNHPMAIWKTRKLAQ